MGKGRKRSNRKRRFGLFGEQNGLCHYCGTPMHNDWQNKKMTEGKIKIGRMTGRPPDNMATIEHVRGRNGACLRIVAACLKCNETRARMLENPDGTHRPHPSGRT